MKPCEYGCGTEVRFVLLGEQDGKNLWSPPMEALTRTVVQKRAWGFEFPPLVVTETFAPHACSEAVHAREAKRAQEQQQHAMHQDWVRKQASAWAEALKRACPSCEAAPKARCINLSDYKRNVSPIREVVYPHSTRLPKGWGQP